MKRTLQTLLFALVAIMMPIGASAHDFESGGIYYNITSAESKTVEVTYSGQSSSSVADEYTGEVTIPATVTHEDVTYSVTTIGKYAFQNCPSLTSITIPNSVTTIGNQAFQNCTSLTSITIPNSVTTIGNQAFSGCSSLTSINIPNSVTTIGEGAFQNCSSLTSITIPNSVTSIGRGAFSGCPSLTSITIPNSVITIEQYAFSGCSSLTSITIPNSVTTIDRRAFQNCSSLTSITIPNSVTTIGEGAFQNCAFLSSNFINNSSCSDGGNWGAMFYTEDEEIDGMIIKDNRLVFARGTLTIVNVPDGVTSIAKNSFFCRSLLTSVSLPNSVTSIETGAFYDCSSLTSITIPNSVTSIGDQAFRGCNSLASMIIPEGVTSINLGTFRDCSSLTSITIPSSVTFIDDLAFYACTSLTSITIPESVTSIGDQAFYGCTSLTDVYYLGSAEQWSAITIGNYNKPLQDATKHYYKNGICTEHDEYQPATLNAEGYYEIENAGQLFWFAQQVNEGGVENRAINGILMNDINLESRSWTPIGTSGGTDSQSFRGIFDGNGKTIRGLNVNAQRSALGFFGEVRKGVVKDFTIYGEVKLNGKYNYVGGVIGSACGIQGDNGSTISGITSYVNVTLGEGSHGSNHVAGLIGYVNHNTTVERCMWLGTLDLDIYRAQDGVGGLIGKANAQCVGTIRDCAAYGTIRTAYKSGSYVNPSDSQPFTNIFIGGIVSNSLAGATTNIENCIWAGNIVDDTDLGENAHIAAIGTLNGVGNVANCYYDLETVTYVTTHNAYDTTGKVFGVSPAQLVSGEIAAKLGEAWGQNIDGEGAKDAKPVVGGAKVYYGYLTCDENASMAYTNNAEVGEVRPEHNHVDGFCTVCGHIDAEGSIVIRDGQHTAFAIADDIDVASITYTRTLPNQEWNSLFVPFEIEVTEAFLQNYDVAYFNNMHAYDKDGNGAIDEMNMEVILIKEGTLKANYPYFIRAKSDEAMEMELVMEDVTLYPTKSTSIYCQSVFSKFTLTGIYNRMETDDFNAIEGTHYAISINGGWTFTNGLNPFRMYMTMTQLDGSPVKVEEQALSRVRICVQGEGGETGVDEIMFSGEQTDVIYDLTGRPVARPRKGGIYVVNGKKVMWK